MLRPAKHFAKSSWIAAKPSRKQIKTSSASRRTRAPPDSAVWASSSTATGSATQIYGARTLSSASVDEKQVSTPHAPKRAFSLLVRGKRFTTDGHLDCLGAGEVACVSSAVRRASISAMYSSSRRRISSFNRRTRSSYSVRILRNNQ